jgi:dTDP-4-dehydrorhamnose reductase
MRLLVTGAGGLIGSNLAAAAAQRGWSVLGTWRGAPVGVSGARTAQLDVADRHACVTLAAGLEPDVIVHAAAESSPARLERDPRLAELGVLATENTLAAAHAVRARYVLVSCEHVFSGLRPSGECWEEEDPTAPMSALGRSLLAHERLARDFGGSWLITRPADVYGVNLSIPAAPGGYGSALAALAAHSDHVWGRSGAPLRWVAWLRAGRPLAAPRGIRRTPTYAWDYAQRVCELIARECEGVYHTAGPTILGRLAHLRLLARAFDCDLRLVQEGSCADLLRAGEPVGPPPDLGSPGGVESYPPVPANTALCDRKASLALGRSAVDPFTGHRLLRRQLEWLLGGRGRLPPTAPSTPSEPALPSPCEPAPGERVRPSAFPAAVVPAARGGG